MNKATKIGLITFGVFTAEALIHYNFGHKKENEKNGKHFCLPPAPEMLKLMAVVGIFSVLNGVIAKSILSNIK